MEGSREAPRASEAGRYDAFLSYAREDSRFVVDYLCGELRSRGHEVWVDVVDIVGGAKWRERVKRGIEACKALIFIVSPASVASEACRHELGEAVALNKLIIPVVYRDVPAPSMPSPLADAEWVFLRDADDPSLGIARLVDALGADLAWRDQHTRLAGRAREWLDSDRDSSYLLRGSDLREAEAWLTQQAGHREAPTREQGEYVARSRQVASRRLYSLVGGLTVALVIAIGLAVFALIQRSTAVRQANIATSRELAASAEADLGPEPEQSIALAARGVRVRQTPEAIHALWHGLVTSRLRAEFREPTPVQSVAFAPNGSSVAIGGEDGAVRLLRVTDHHLLWSTGGGELPATSLAFAPSGSVLLVGRGSVSARGCLVEVLSATTGDRERMLGSAGTGTCVRFVGFLGTTGLAAVGAGDGTLEWWDVQRGHLLQRAHLLDPADLPVTAMAVGADGKALALVGLHSVVEMNTRNGKLTTIRSAPSGIFNPNGVAFSPDDNEMLISGEYDTELYDLSQHAGVDLYAQVTASRAPTWSSDGRLVAAAVGFTGIDVWRASSTRLVEQLHGGSAATFAALAFARNGLLAGGSDDGSVRVWAPDPDLPDRVFPASSSIAAYAAPGAHLAVFGDAQNGLSVFDDFGKLVKSISLDGDGPIALASAGQVAFTRHDRLDVLQLPSGTLIRSWALPSGSAPSGVAVSGDARTAATIAANGTVTLFSTTRPPATFLPHDETPTATITLSPDARLLTVDTSRGLAIINTSDRGLVRTEPAVTSGSAIFSASGRFLAIQRPDLSIAITSTTNWRTRAVIEGEPVQAALSFSPDDRLLAATGGDAMLRVWDTADGALLTSKQVIESSFAATQTGLSRPAFTAAGFALIAAGSEGSGFAYRVCDGCLDAAALLREADARLRAITAISAP